LPAPFYETAGELIKKLLERLFEEGILDIHLTKELHVNTHPVFTFAYGATPNTTEHTL
jgi:hypothetical protein